MTTKETIDKLIQKYEAEIADLIPVRGQTSNIEFKNYLDGKIENSTKFLTDLKELKNTLK